MTLILFEVKDRIVQRKKQQTSYTKMISVVFSSLCKSLTKESEVRERISTELDVNCNIFSVIEGQVVPHRPHTGANWRVRVRGE